MLTAKIELKTNVGTHTKIDVLGNNKTSGAMHKYFDSLNSYNNRVRISRLDELKTKLDLYEKTLAELEIALMRYEVLDDFGIEDEVKENIAKLRQLIATYKEEIERIKKEIEDLEKQREQYPYIMKELYEQHLEELGFVKKDETNTNGVYIYTGDETQLYAKVVDKYNKLKQENAKLNKPKQQEDELSL